MTASPRTGHTEAGGDHATAVTVAFSGARGGEAPQTWGQRALWRAIPILGEGEHFLNLKWTLPVPGRHDLDTVLRALRTLLERHESLRTTYADTPEGPVQRVAREGALTVRIVEAGEERPREVAERLAAEMAAVAFDHGRELPLRCAIVTRAGRPMALGLTFSHVSLDAGALDLVAAEWRRLLAGEELPPPDWQPLDQAAYESSGPGAARGAKAIEYWRSILLDAPLDVFDFPPGEAEDPRCVELGMDSAALAVAAEILAGRWSISTSSVLLGTWALIMATVQERRRAILQIIASNRHDPRLRRMVGAVGLDGLFVLDLPETNLAEVCRAAHRRALAAYRTACYDPYEQHAMREEIGRLRGRVPDLDAFFNDARAVDGWPNRPRLAPGEDPAVLTGRTTAYVVGPRPGERVKAFFTVGLATHTARLRLIADTAYLPVPMAESMLRGVETLLLRGVGGDVPVAAAAEVIGKAARGRRGRAPEDPEGRPDPADPVNTDKEMV